MVQLDSTPPRSICLALPSFVTAVLDGAAPVLTTSHPCTVSLVPPSVTVAALELGAPPRTPLSNQFTAAITSAPRPFPLASSSASSPDQPVIVAAPSIMQVAPSAIHPCLRESSLVVGPHSIHGRSVSITSTHRRRIARHDRPAIGLPKQ